MRSGASKPDARFLVDVHVHAGAPSGAEAMAKEIHSPKDWALQRSKAPKEFAEVMSEEQNCIICEVVKGNGPVSQSGPMVMPLNLAPRNGNRQLI